MHRRLEGDGAGSPHGHGEGCSARGSDFGSARLPACLPAHPIDRRPSGRPRPSPPEKRSGSYLEDGVGQPVLAVRGMLGHAGGSPSASGTGRVRCFCPSSFLRVGLEAARGAAGCRAAESLKRPRHAVPAKRSRGGEAEQRSARRGVVLRGLELPL